MSYTNRVPYAKKPFENLQSYEFVTDDGGGISTTDFIEFTNFFKKQGGDSWSIAFWLRRNTQGAGWVGHVFNNSSLDEGTGNDGIIVRATQPSPTTDSFRLDVSFDGENPGEDLSALATMTFTTGVWHHFVVTYGGGFDANNFNFYQNATLLSKVVVGNNLSSPTTIPYNNSLASIGHNQNFPVDAGFEVQSRIDEISFWNKELSGSEITEKYNSGVANDLFMHSAYIANNSDLEAWIRHEKAIASGNTAFDETGQHNGTYSTGTDSGNASSDAP